MEINPPNINPLDVRKNLGANQEGNGSFPTVVVVWMWSSHDTLVGLDFILAIPKLLQQIVLTVIRKMKHIKQNDS